MSMEDKRYRVMWERLKELSITELRQLEKNMELVCTDEWNYDLVTRRFCPLAVATGLDSIPRPSDFLVKKLLSERFKPVNALKGVEGFFYYGNHVERLKDLRTIVSRVLQFKVNPLS